MSDIPELEFEEESEGEHTFYNIICLDVNDGDPIGVLQYEHFKEVGGLDHEEWRGWVLLPDTSQCSMWNGDMLRQCADKIRELEKTDVSNEEP